MVMFFYVHKTINEEQMNFLSRSFENYCFTKNLKRPPKIKTNLM